MSVESITFNTEAADKQRKEELDYENQQKQALWLKIALAILAVLGVLYIVRSRRKITSEELEDEVAATTEPVMPIVESEMTAQEKQLVEKRKELEKLAKTKPEDVAQLIKVWLSEE